MELSAILTAVIAPVLLGLAPVAAVKDFLARDCVERPEARQMVKARSGRPDCRKRHFVLM